MSHIVRFAEGEVEERLGALEKYLTEMQLHRDSRRGLEGVRGEKGETGSTGAVGAQGAPGKDADITQVVEAALKKVKEEFDQEYAILAQVVRHALVTGGVLDENGKAILIPGPTGAPGADSQVAGPRGDIGPAGPAGHDGKSIIGPQGERGQDGADSIVPGPKGDTGPAGRDGIDGRDGAEGPQGIPGPGLGKDAIVQLVMDLKRRGSI